MNNKKIFKLFASSLILVAGTVSGFAQNSLPAPGSGGGFGGGSMGSSAPAPGSGGMYAPNGIGWNPGPPPPSNWGGPWGGSSPVIVVNTPLSSPTWQNSGRCNVIACGYDAQGIWRTIPLRVAYNYNGVNYNVTVINAWNPWSDMWVRGVNAPAYNTSYFLRGQTYDFYTVLPTGTYYFNL